MKKIMETSCMVVIEHPAPAYPFHLLILPKAGISDFSKLAADSEFWLSLPEVVAGLVSQYHLESGYRLITNVGEYQDVPQLHFHLVSG